METKIERFFPKTIFVLKFRPTSSIVLDVFFLNPHMYEIHQFKNQKKNPPFFPIFFKIKL